jgi:hypothetical protein
MLTKLIESSKRKCHPYWPEDPGGSVRIGRITVTNVEVLELGPYTLTTLNLADGSTGRDGQPVTHTVSHYWFKKWPDHGVPTDGEGTFQTTDVLTLLRAVRRQRVMVDKKESPLLVHCSAGIGRTGTIIVIDHVISAVRFNDAIDVLQIIASIRRDRMCLVQHTEQYRYAHQAAFDLIREHQSKSVKVYTAVNRSSSGPEYQNGATIKAWIKAKEVGGRALYQLTDDVPRSQRSDADLEMFAPHAADEVASEAVASLSQPGSPPHVLSPALPTSAATASDPTVHQLLQHIPALGLATLAPQLTSTDTALTSREKEDLKMYPWFKPSHSKHQADMLIVNGNPGAFVVRNSNRHPGCFAMNVRENRHGSHGIEAHVKNMLIIPEGTGFKLGQLGDRLFGSVAELVSYFITYPYDADPVTGEHLRLQFPE